MVDEPVILCNLLPQDCVLAILGRSDLLCLPCDLVKPSHGSIQPSLRLADIKPLRTQSLDAGRDPVDLSLRLLGVGDELPNRWASSSRRRQRRQATLGLDEPVDAVEHLGAGKGQSVGVLKRQELLGQVRSLVQAADRAGDLLDAAGETLESLPADCFVRVECVADGQHLGLDGRQGRRELPLDGKCQAVELLGRRRQRVGKLPGRQRELLQSLRVYGKAEVRRLR